MSLNCQHRWHCGDSNKRLCKKLIHHKKLLGVKIYNELNFDDHVKSQAKNQW